MNLLIKILQEFKMMKDILGFGAFTRSIGLSTFRLITKINGTNFAKNRWNKF